MHSLSRLLSGDIGQSGHCDEVMFVATHFTQPFFISVFFVSSLDNNSSNYCAVLLLHSMIFTLFTL